MWKARNAPTIADLPEIGESSGAVHSPVILDSSKATTADPVTSAAPAILVLFYGAIAAAIVIAFTFEITCMAASAERRVT